MHPEADAAHLNLVGAILHLVVPQIDRRGDGRAFQRDRHARLRFESHRLAVQHEAADRRGRRLREHEGIRRGAAGGVHARLQRKQTREADILAAIVGFMFRAPRLNLLAVRRIGRGGESGNHQATGYRQDEKPCRHRSLISNG